MNSKHEKSAAARQRIIEAGAKLIMRNGYHATGIQDILKAAEIPRGSFYFYFENKEDFGLQTIDYFMTYFLVKLQEYTAMTGLPPLQRLRAFFEDYLMYFANRNFSIGCPVGNLIQELADNYPSFREKLGEAMNRIVTAFRDIIEEAKAHGSLHQSADSKALAGFILYSWEGAIMAMKVEKSNEALRRFDDLVFNHLLRDNKPFGF